MESLSGGKALTTRKITSIDRQFAIKKQPGRRRNSIRILRHSMINDGSSHNAANEESQNASSAAAALEKLGWSAETEEIDTLPITNLNMESLSGGKALLKREITSIDKKNSIERQLGRKNESIRLLKLSRSEHGSYQNAANEKSQNASSADLEKLEGGIAQTEKMHTEKEFERSLNEDVQTKQAEENSQPPKEKKEWFLDTFTLQEQIELISNVNFVELLYIAFWSSASTAVVLYCLDEKWKLILNNSTRSIGIMGGFLSFALVFRTNICYDRWWEARTAWGGMTTTTLHCAQQGKSWIADDALSSRFLIMNIVFAYASKASLRGNSLASEVEEGPSLVKSGIIQQDELDIIHSQPGSQPYYCLDVMREIINVSWSTENGCTLKDQGSRQAAYKALEDSIRELSKNLGPCNKVKATGLPVSYNTFMNTFIKLFFGWASLSWSPELLWFTPAAVCAMFCLMQLFIIIGNNMQEPFGTNFASLPLQKLCVGVEKKLSALEERQKIRAHMATGNFTSHTCIEDSSSKVLRKR